MVSISDIMFEVKNVADVDGHKEVEMDGHIPIITPPFVANNRARLKALEEVGREEVAGGILEMARRAQIGRVTDLLVIEQIDTEPGFDVKRYVVSVQTEE